MRIRFAVLLAMLLAGGAQAQMQTTAEVKPILQMTRGNWVAVREYDGQDLLYFTHLEVFRCGLEQIRYVINDGKPSVWETPACAGDDTFTGIPADRLPYAVFPAKSIKSVRIELTYDDGTVETESFERGAIMTP